MINKTKVNALLDQLVQCYSIDVFEEQSNVNLEWGAEITGDPNNQVALLTWTDADGLEFNIILTEQGLNDATVSENLIALKDVNGEEVTLALWDQKSWPVEKRLSDALEKEKEAPDSDEIVPVNEGGPHRTGTLTGITAKEITKILGFASNVDDYASKVKYSWGFKIGGKLCGIWDYKGSYRYKQFSTYGPDHIFKKLFGDRYQK